MTESKPDEALHLRMREALEGVPGDDREELVTAIESLARKIRYRTIQEGEQ